VGTLRDALADGGIGWVDMPVAGGGGSDAMTVLRARVTAGDPPTAVQMLGFSIQDWAAEGALANLERSCRRAGLGRRGARGAAALLDL
jgi:glucose/mannose transport system substrate-binding protein